MMGNLADAFAAREAVPRAEQDAFAARSYALAAAAASEGLAAHETTPAALPPSTRGGPPLASSCDEEVARGAAGLPALARQPPAFDRAGGTVTAGSSSSLGDGAAALVLASGEAAARAGWRPLARVLGCADAQGPPGEFMAAPAEAVAKALARAGSAGAMQGSTAPGEALDLLELNEAFAVGTLVAARRLGLSPAAIEAKVNVLGGACAMGHPLGCSGARIVVTLLNALRVKGGRLGAGARLL